ncbi:Os04g0456100 [Oryza sativa Japonica Group]|uniref:Uncharacterized protein n=4 Tax=Oryza TaxID=4527 RepID=A0A8J8XIT8_ORYSJ|nr:hypothetical protein OsJ_15025 [Oryza sativa Japonica Group]KAB8095580.1 hypothetical protein EE612_023702 [Oryza sativa]BAS89505.1 Os04g0456100 [Oryza sativa Japonica Group]
MGGAWVMRGCDDLGAVGPEMEESPLGPGVGSSGDRRQHLRDGDEGGQGPATAASSLPPVTVEPPHAASSPLQPPRQCLRTLRHSQQPPRRCPHDCRAATMDRRRR